MVVHIALNSTWRHWGHIRVVHRRWTWQHRLFARVASQRSSCSVTCSGVARSIGGYTAGIAAGVCMKIRFTPMTMMMMMTLCRIAAIITWRRVNRRTLAALWISMTFVLVCTRYVCYFKLSWHRIQFVYCMARILVWCESKIILSTCS